MVNCDVSAANGKLRRREVGVPKGVVGLVINVEGPEKGLCFRLCDEELWFGR